MVNKSKMHDGTSITFPCDFPIKIVSHASIDLEDFVTQIVHKYSPQMEHIPLTKNSSKHGKYQALTVVIKAVDQQQLDNIYQDITANPLIIMVL